MHISARNKYIVKVSMVKYTQINAYLAKKSPDTQTKAKIPRSSEKSPAVATLVSCLLYRILSIMIMHYFEILLTSHDS